MRHLVLIVLSIAQIFIAEAATQQADAPKPNIVHIFVDDIGWQDIASHKIDGNAIYETPNLDRLTQLGRRFTQAYSPAPTCAPSRAAFLRGQYPANTGVYHVMGGRLPRPISNNAQYLSPFYNYGLSKDVPTVAKVLKKAGYTTGHVGKWHLGGKSEGYPFPPDLGFDFGFTEVPTANQKRTNKIYNDAELWNPKDGKRNSFFGIWSKMKPDRISDFATDSPDDPYQLNDEGRPFDKPLDLAIGFMRKNKGEPFFLNFCTFMVHGPFGSRDRARFEHYCKKMGYEVPNHPDPLNAGKLGHNNPYYAAMLDSLDWMVGQIITFLEQTDDPRNPGHKLIDNTYVIVDSDNGGYNGSPKEPITDNTPLTGGKMTTHEGGIRIPFLIRGPGVAAGSECDTPINLIDLFPTFMEMAGLPGDPSLKLDGGNILPLIEGSSDKAVLADGKPREAIYWYYPAESHMSMAMRKGDWKLLYNFGTGLNKVKGVELFRLYNADGTPNDLGEKVNLADQHPEIRDAMLAELQAFMKSTGAAMPYRNPMAKGNEEERLKLPAITELGMEKDRVWATFDTSKGKSRIVEGKLLYTLTPPLLEATQGHREEWFPAEATLTEGRIEAIMPPGATHGVFCMVDENGFVVTSEPLPDQQAAPISNADSSLLKNGYAYKPGLFALITLGESARKSSQQAGVKTSSLDEAIAAAKLVYQNAEATEVVHCDAIRALRRVIRELDGAPESSNLFINRYPYDPVF
jgi:arylsulfatase A-like enzyme